MKHCFKELEVENLIDIRQLHFSYILFSRLFSFFFALSRCQRAVYIKYSIFLGFANVTNYFRSSRPKVVCKKHVLKNVAKFTGKHMCRDLFFHGLSL